MKDFKGKVAVVTGAASGIGRGLAEHCAKEGMKVVFRAIRNNVFYVLNDPAINPIIRQRVDNILEGRGPMEPYVG